MSAEYRTPSTTCLTPKASWPRSRRPDVTEQDVGGARWGR